jgi:predicted transcriptional regulator of viral defense system
MKINELRSISRLYFGYEDIARALKIDPASARVSASRYVRLGLLMRLKRNTYVLRERWRTAGREERFALANLGQSPSYISLMTALDYHEITTQVQRALIESVAVKRTKELSLNGAIFRYTKIGIALYFGFIRQQNFFIATPEKAFLDAVYLMSFGRYALDLAAIDGEKLNRKEIRRMSRNYPTQTRKMLEKNGYLGSARNI